MVLEEYAARGTGVCSRLEVPPGLKSYLSYLRPSTTALKYTKYAFEKYDVFENTSTFL